jgi:drug/metabolite transporter (DMT)-like permease
MSVVAPISATGVAIPVLAGLLSGERPSALQVGGIALACGGVVLAARAAPSEDAAQRHAGRVAIGLALLAAVGFGTFFTGIDRAEETADVAWVLLSARTAAITLLLVACAVVRPTLPREPAALAPIALVGVFDLLANLLFVIAAGEGLLSVVGVLGSLYPAVTVLLARVVLRERLSPTQRAGVAVTLAGVVALAAG